MFFHLPSTFSCLCERGCETSVRRLADRTPTANWSLLFRHRILVSARTSSARVSGALLPAHPLQLVVASDCRCLLTSHTSGSLKSVRIRITICTYTSGTAGYHELTRLRECVESPSTAGNGLGFTGSSKQIGERIASGYLR